MAKAKASKGVAAAQAAEAGKKSKAAQKAQAKKVAEVRIEAACKNFCAPLLSTPRLYSVSISLSNAFVLRLDELAPPSVTPSSRVRPFPASHPQPSSSEEDDSSSEEESSDEEVRFGAPPHRQSRLAEPPPWSGLLP